MSVWSFVAGCLVGFVLSQLLHVWPLERLSSRLPRSEAPTSEAAVQARQWRRPQEFTRGLRLSELPPELLTRVYDHASLKDCLEGRRVCRRWRDALHQPCRDKMRSFRGRAFGQEYRISGLD